MTSDLVLKPLIGGKKNRGLDFVATAAPIVESHFFY